MIKKIALIGLIILSLAGCTNKSIDQNEQSNPGQGENTTGGQADDTNESLEEDKE